MMFFFEKEDIRKVRRDGHTRRRRKVGRT